MGRLHQTAAVADYVQVIGMRKRIAATLSTICSVLLLCSAAFAQAGWHSDTQAGVTQLPSLTSLSLTPSTNVGSGTLTMPAASSSVVLLGSYTAALLPARIPNSSRVYLLTNLQAGSVTLTPQGSDVLSIGDNSWTGSSASVTIGARTAYIIISSESTGVTAWTMLPLNGEWGSVAPSAGTFSAPLANAAFVMSNATTAVTLPIIPSTLHTLSFSQYYYNATGSSVPISTQTGNTFSGSTLGSGSNPGTYNLPANQGVLLLASVANGSGAWYVLSETCGGVNSTITSMSGLTGTIADSSTATNAIDLTGANGGIRFKSGSNTRVGTGTLSAGTVTISNTSVTANSLIVVIPTSNSAASGALSVTTITPSTSFVVKSGNASDANTFFYLIFEKQ